MPSIPGCCMQFKLHVPTHAVACLQYQAMASQVCQRKYSM